MFTFILFISAFTLLLYVSSIPNCLLAGSSILQINYTHTHMHCIVHVVQIPKQFSSQSSLLLIHANFLLGFLDVLWHGKENAVDKNGEHDNVVKVLVGGEEDIQASEFVPRSKNE